MVPEPVVTFGEAVVNGLSSVLRDGLVGAYFVGSVALGGYIAGESDVDVAAVCRRSLDSAEKRCVVEAVEETVSSCPARGLEFTLYRAAVVAAAPRGADFEVNVNGGPRMDRAVHLDAAQEHAFWYVIDRCIAHRFGVPILGPPAAEVFVDVDRATLVRSVYESMRWHRENERTSLYSVLNAARAWRFATDGELGSKLDGAAWARDRWHRPWVIDAAVELRHGRPARLEAADVAELLEHTQQVLERQLDRLGQPWTDVGS